MKKGTPFSHPGGYTYRELESGAFEVMRPSPTSVGEILYPGSKAHATIIRDGVPEYDGPEEWVDDPAFDTVVRAPLEDIVVPGAGDDAPSLEQLRAESRITAEAGETPRQVRDRVGEALTQSVERGSIEARNRMRKSLGLSPLGTSIEASEPKQLDAIHGMSKKMSEV